IADDALVASVFVHDLSDVLGDEVCLETKPSHVRKRVRKNLHTFEGRKFVDQEKQAVFVAQLLRTLKVELFGETIDDHGEDETHEWAKPDLVTRRDDKIKRYRPVVIHEIL